ncbi:hypothetical protein IAT40_006470 [Kwoniella sp. CBS 6097]
MSMEQNDHASLATLLQYDQGKAAEDADSHGLMDYFQENYPHTEPTGDVNAQHVRADPSHSGLTPLPGHVARPLSTSHENHQSPSGRASQIHTPHARDFNADADAASPLLVPRSPSPPNPGIPLPNSLVRLASQALSNYDLPNMALLTGQQAIEQASLANDLADRGEMGGKRRKEPHQRAGWKEMDEQPQGVKRRRTRKTDSNQGRSQVSPQAAIGGNINGSGPGSGPAAQGTENEINQLTELSRLAMSGDIVQAQAHAPAQQHIPVDPSLQADAAAGNGEAKEQVSIAGQSSAPMQPQLQERGQGAILTPAQAQGEEPALEGDDSKLSRAEQNKRAQQAFRRRREEHMKKLELDSAQLQILKKHSEQRDLVTKDALFSLEAHKIEIAALREIIRTLIPASSISPLNKEGYFNTGDESPLPRDQVPQGPEVLEGAFEILGRQAREVVKLHHIGVDEGSQPHGSIGAGAGAGAGIGEISAVGSGNGAEIRKE